MGHSRIARVELGLARASTLDTTRVITTVVLPLAARGVLLRRPPVVALAERLDLDRRAVHLLQRLRARYGPGPLLLRVPGRSIALVLSPEGVQRVLSGSPEPFPVANREKRGALSHFQPHGVLVSHGQLRVDRREVNDAVLDSHRPVHRLAEAIPPRSLTRPGRSSPTARRDPWPGTSSPPPGGVRCAGWCSGTPPATTMSSPTCWPGCAPTPTGPPYIPNGPGSEHGFLQRLRAALDEPEPSSLAELVASTPSPAETDPDGQVPQWSDRRGGLSGWFSSGSG